MINLIEYRLDLDLLEVNLFIEFFIAAIVKFSYLDLVRTWSSLFRMSDLEIGLDRSRSNLDLYLSRSKSNINFTGISGSSLHTLQKVVVSRPRV